MAVVGGGGGGGREQTDNARWQPPIVTGSAQGPADPARSSAVSGRDSQVSWATSLTGWAQESLSCTESGAGMV